MKITGFTGDAVRRKRIALEREDDNIEILLTALPPSYMDTISTELPEPVPPLEKVPARDDKGRFLKDEFGNRVFPPRLNDPKYKLDVVEHQNLTAVALAYHAMEKDPNISFEAQRSGAKDGREFYRTIRNEMEEFGLNMGDIAQIVKSVVGLTGLSEEDVMQARTDFLDQPQTE